MCHFWLYGFLLYEVFLNACMHACSLNHVQPFAVLWTIACQIPLSMGFPRNTPVVLQNTGEGCHFLLQGIFLTQGSNPGLLHWQADSLPLYHLGSPSQHIYRSHLPKPCFPTSLTAKSQAYNQSQLHSPRGPVTFENVRSFTEKQAWKAKLKVPKYDPFSLKIFYCS